MKKIKLKTLSNLDHHRLVLSAQKALRIKGGFACPELTLNQYMAGAGCGD